MHWLGRTLWAYLGWFILPIFAALVWWYPRLGARWFDPIEKAAAHFSSRKSATLAAIALTALAVRLALLVALPVPVPAVHDEFGYLLEADTFVHGRLTNPPHPLWIFFDTFHVLQHPTYQAMYPPAQGAVLALGRLLGHPWIGVLLSTVVMCAAMTWMLQGWFPPHWALLGGVLVLLRLCWFSYWLESYWGGAIAATGGALVLGAFRRIVHHRRPTDALLMGLGAGLLAVSRPLEGAWFCIPVAIAFLAWLVSLHGREIWTTARRLIPPLLFAPCIALIFTGYYNRSVTGSAFVDPHVLDARLYQSLPPFVWQAPIPRRVYSNAQFEGFYNVWSIRAYRQPFLRLCWYKIYDWWRFFVGSSLALPLLALPWVLRDRRTRLPLVLCVWCGLGLLAVIYFEPHYAAPMAGAFFIVLVQSMRHLRRWQIGGRPVGIFLTRLVLLLGLAQLGVLTVAAYQHPLLDWSVYRDRIERQLEATPGKQLVIVRYAPDHNVHHEWVYNGADIDGEKVAWAREIPGRDLRPLLEYFHDRTVWVVEADQNPPKLEPY